MTPLYENSRSGDVNSVIFFPLQVLK